MPPTYKYVHARTLGTTGYADCQPEFSCDLEAAINLLRERPLDTFLHRHLLKQILAENPASWEQFAQNACQEGNAPLAALMLEVMAIRPQNAAHLAGWQPRLLELCQPLAKHTPLTILLANKADTVLKERFLQNINAHTSLESDLSLPFTQAEIGQTFAQMQAALECLQQEYAQLRSQPPAPETPQPELKEIYAKASERLAAQGVLAGPEMRHEASLCPIALLRSWQLSASVNVDPNRHLLKGSATAYGRGLSLAQARVSCIMEIVERASAHAQIDAGGICGRLNGCELAYNSWTQLADKGVAAINPCALGAVAGAENLSLHWLQGEDTAGGTVFAPVQAVCLFCNLAEPDLFEHLGSTGLAAGVTRQAAKLAALTEVLERDAQATMPFFPKQCFELVSKDQRLQALLEDYRWRGIHVQFQDITTEFGLPAYRCFVQGKDGAVAQATGAGLSGPKAALAALTETPWPYAWANPAPAPSGRGLSNLPQRVLEDLPDYSLGSVSADLALLERLLLTCGYKPVYADLTRQDLGFPVYRALVPGLVADCEFDQGPSLRLCTHYQHNKALFHA